MAKPTVDHWKAAKSVLRYLSCTCDVGLVFNKAKAGLRAYCDADYAGNIDTRKSTTGFVFILHGGAIVWRSKLQATVACSTVEAEYISASSTVKEALWLRMLLHDFGIRMDCVNIACDNQGAINIAKDPIASVRSKHIDVIYHFIRERIARGEIALSYCSTDDMAADLLTKAVPLAKFDKCKVMIGCV
jgi:uridylate kinase